MRCLYCGKELALLKRLTGGGEFCSEAHKQSYQEEYNRLALSRLLQAQKKKGQQANAPGQSAVPPVAAVAVEESAPEAPAEVSVRVPEVEPTAPETLAAELTPEAAPAARSEPEPSTLAQPELPALAEPEPAAPAEPEPMELAGFLPEVRGLAASADVPPYQEAWVELALSPALSNWQAENAGTFELSPANLQALDWALNASSITDRAPAADLPAQAWPSGQPAVSSAAMGNRTAGNRLASAAAIAIQITPVVSPAASDQTFVQPVPAESAILVGQSEFLEVAPTSIEFPAEDADVVVLERSYDGERNVPAEDTTPRSSLEALSRLHQEMIEEQEEQEEQEQQEEQAPPKDAAPEDAAPERATLEEAAPVESVGVAPETVVPVEFIQAPEIIPALEVSGEIVAVPVVQSAAEEPAAEPVTIDIVAEPAEPAEQESRPAYVTDLLEISLRIFPPSKGMPRAGELLPASTAPLLPHSKALPLRPKVGLAKGYAPGAPATAETAATWAAPARKAAARAAPAKPAAVPVKQAAPPARVEAPPVEKAAPAQAAAAAPEVKVPEVKVQEVKTEVKKTEPVSRTAEQAPPAEQAASATQIKTETTKPEPAKSEPPKSSPIRPEPLRFEPGRSASSGKKEDVPTFGIASQSASVPWYGSLKVKLGIAILLLLIATIYFLSGGKSQGPTSSNAGSGDGSGPSIILGEGGWVEGWAGDPSGMHVGRQITIYRPSLKLSDYRIEFQASIDVKSIGWVFRAADPQNYYAMKIATVSPALPLKVALFKYLVANGRQTQVGRVPIEIPVRPDTVFNIREDVRGPHFTTYIQGQQIDSWTDDQLKVGGVGFLNEREERGKVSSVSIRYLTGGK